MSDWIFLEKNRVKEWCQTVHPMYFTTAADGFNGMFRFVINGHLLRCVVSDGEDWKHVSVSIEGESKPPQWGVMCRVKDLFWEPEDWVVQFHPAASEYVNHHPGCLHLWQYTGTEFKMPTPDSIMVGIKKKYVIH